MAEGDEGRVPVVHEGMSKSEAETMFKAHKDEINNLFDERSNKIKEEIRELGAGDKRDREELQQELKELKEWKADQLKKEKEAQDTKGDHHTLVTPPANIPPPTPAGQPAETQPEQRKRHWFWDNI